MLIEILLIVLCVVASSRFRAANEKGVGAYIGGVWGTWGGAFILACIIGSISQSVGAILVVILIGYVIEIIIAVNAVRAGNAYLKYHEQKKAQDQQNEQKKLSESVADLQRQLAEQKQLAEQNRPKE